MDASLRYLLRRLAFGLVAVWAVVTIVFLFVSLTPDPYLARLMHWETRHTRGDATADVMQLKTAYMTARGLQRPLWVRYTDWLVNIATGNWGTSFTTGAPVAMLLADYTRRTALYVLPAMVCSSILGGFIGLYSAANRYSIPDRLTTFGAYLGMGIPNFYIAAMALIFLEGGSLGTVQVFLNDPTIPLTQYILPGAVLTTVLLGNQIHYARAEVHEHLNENFVEVLRAKGVSKFRVARHVLRNAALPLFSLFFADLLAVLMLHIFVLESIFQISGLGRLTLLAVDTRDMPLVLGVTMVVVIVGIAGNLLQDLLSFVLDPRIRSGTE